MKRYRIIVHGRVQGVFYRASTLEQAKKLKLTGTVANQSDGTVLIEAEGEIGLLDELIKWCRKGPILAKVSKLDIEEIPVKNSDDFKITY